MKIKTIFFDFDGVIADSLDVKTNAFYKMYEPYGKDIAEAVAKHHIENGGMSRFEKFRIYHKRHLNEKITEHQVEALAGRFSKLVVTEVINSDFVAGVKEFLEANHHRYDSYIITGTPTEEMKIIAKGKGIDHYFKGIYGSPESKDHWVRQILEAGDIAADSCVFIGDALSDYNAAIGNNIPFILREHNDNIPLFKGKDVIRIKDFIDFETVLQNLTPNF